MKTIKIPLMASAIIMLFILTGCNKEYGDRYTGSWRFITERIHYHQISGKLKEVKRESITFSGKIIHGTSENTLIFSYTEHDEVNTWVTKEANIYSEVGVHPNSFLSGRFESKNKLSLNLCWDKHDCLQGNAGFIYDHIVGTKVKGK